MAVFSEPASARQEAEKLVAALLAAAAVAANANPHWSTGSRECCVCPLCKVIAAVRDPDPEMIERVATGAGDLAAGMASFLRHVSSPAAPQDPWKAATETAGEQTAPPSAPPPVVKKVVKKAAKKAVKKVDPEKAG
jgi:hypothetical protein